MLCLLIRITKRYIHVLWDTGSLCRRDQRGFVEGAIHFLRWDFPYQETNVARRKVFARFTKSGPDDIRPFDYTL